MKLQTRMLLLSVVLLTACAERSDLQGEWLRRLAQMKRYAEALEVYAQMPPEQAEQGALRNKAMLSHLGVRGYGSAFVVLLSETWSDSPQELWANPELKKLQDVHWVELRQVAEDLSRPQDRGGMRRLLAGVRYVGSLAGIRAALAADASLAEPVAAFRRAVDYCATQDPGDGRHAHVSAQASAASRVVQEQLKGLNPATDEALVAWLTQGTGTSK